MGVTQLYSCVMMLFAHLGVISRCWPGILHTYEALRGKFAISSKFKAVDGRVGKRDAS